MGQDQQADSEGESLAASEQGSSASPQRSTSRKSVVDEISEGITALEREFLLKPSGDGSAVDDYTEMLLQLGYVIFFAAAFPLCSLLALLNNIMEIRLDGFRYLYIQKRNWYKAAESIGAWVPIIEFMSFFSIITNCALLVLLAPVFENADAYTKAMYVFGLEHLFLLIKVLLMYGIPDVSPATARLIENDAIRKEKEEAAEESDVWEALGRDRDALQKALIQKNKLSEVPDGIDRIRDADTSKVSGAQWDPENEVMDPLEAVDVPIGDGLDRIPVGPLYKWKYKLEDGKLVKDGLTDPAPRIVDPVDEADVELQEQDE